ncbi:adenylate/guanylate cyclase domain-containing protein [Mycobacterium sp. PS03-16]|uniref:adenylate/guanylate cyclase domain-containing protein n=1 Tax=Mycobacterium sp. PS03-16 TaxID=2559611 RepID=UPI001073EC7D|nr:adenylate/guanylate cyclase domain-containing protein [Mycobacterium sp. PS03-16]TFV61479.1 adenylate/guanylate cyclase domain-containing protein [Mycobacterium sp. PS03-16]
MASAPETLYARDGDAHLAYQVVGDAGPDLLFVPTATFPIDLLWDEPTVAGHLHHLASFSRLIVTDLLGTGSSDAVPIKDRPAMQSWADGLVAVLDAVGSESATVFGTSESGLPVLLLAASHPQRVRSLVLWSPFARYVRGPDHPIGMPEPVLERYLDIAAQAVGSGAVVDRLAPSWSGDAAKRRWWARGERLAGGPAHFRAILDLFLHSDIRPALDSVQAPALLLHRRGDRHVRGEHAADMAARMAHARHVELDGVDNPWFAGDAGRVLDEIESFVTGGRAAAPSNRVLSTVLFTDIVGSTELAAALGDEAWTALLAGHDRMVDREVNAARGQLVKFTGDGALGAFDGPARAIQCARAIREGAAELGLTVRAGLHTGEVEVADGDVHGIAVHIAARIMALAAPGEVLVSGVVPPLVLGSRIAFTDRGRHDLKGVPQRWPVFAVRDFPD